ncbi:MAG: DUF2510 domain-containing protein [Actinomycetota bacterium]|nr:DUF2510 domain-containing protein [Actinomycetota bacterium]
MHPTASPPGWHPDPTGRYEFRYFNGQRWTHDVSVNGERFVDIIAPTTTPDADAAFGAQPAHVTGWGPTPPTPRPPGRGFAIASFAVGLGSFVFGWIPFAFAVGLGGAVAAIVFGIIALRRGNGRSYAVAGIVLSFAAMGASVVGFHLTRLVLREIDRFIEAGPHEVDVDRCDTDDNGLVTLDGTITNLDDEVRSYTITIRYTVDNDTLETDLARVADVDPGATAEFHGTTFADAGDVVRCEIDSVTGPIPFDTDD